MAEKWQNHFLINFGHKFEVVAEDPNYTFDYYRGKDLKQTCRRHSDLVYNKAWAKRGEVPELSQAQARNMVRQMKPIDG
jgi:hypothetical protein